MADGSDSKKIDELLRKARNLQARTNTDTSDDPPSVLKKDNTGSVIGDALKDVKDGIESVKAVKATQKEVTGGMELVKQTGMGVWNFIKNSWPAKAYMWLFNKVAYKKDKETGEKKFRPKRAKAMILSTIFAGSALIPGMIGAPARTIMGAVTEPVMDGVRMASMYHHDEIMYLNDQHIANADENLWVVKGTLNPNGGVDDAVLFYVKPSLAHDIWSWANTGNPMFIPDQVVAPVAPGANNMYRVTYYGVRWRLATWLQAYPQLLDVQALTPQEAAEFNARAQRGGDQPQQQQERQQQQRQEQQQQDGAQVEAPSGAARVVIPGGTANTP